jgi:energy-coupling factor transporter ATP-binding protein EcfA2
MPYVGLRPFEAEDQPLFFGREEQVAAMLHQLEDHRFVAVVGSSGSGKSSLVRAGLLPAIRESFLLGSSSWLLLIIKPGHQPYSRLGCRLLSETIHPASEPSAPTTDLEYHDQALAITKTLRWSDRGLLEALTEANVSPESRVMVVVDQFEELFAFRRKEGSRNDVASRDESASFVRMLLRSASDPSGRVWVVLTMRSDFIGNCETFLGLPEAVSRSQFLVPRLDREQMEEAIRCPSEVKGAEFSPFTFEKGLINRIINEAGDRPDQLPLLQHALMRTWKLATQRALRESRSVELNHHDYEEAGRIDHALSLHADTAWRTIADDAHKANLARQVFLLLCDVSPDGQITRRRPKVTHVVAATGSSTTEIEEIVRLFQSDDRNFLLPPLAENLAPDSYLDLSHEALLRQWEIFANDWLVRERNDAEELRTLVKQASDFVGGRGGLLGEEDLKRILDWQTRVSPHWAGRYVTQEQWGALLTFIQKSENEIEQQRNERAWQDKLRRRLWSALSIILMLATAISVILTIRANRAEDLAIREKSAAVEALVRSIVRPIGSELYWSPSTDQQEALWELAGLDPANQNVRQEVIRHWLKTADSLQRALTNDHLGLHAAIGLNKSMRTLFDSQTGEAAKILSMTLENPRERNFTLLSNSSVALIALAQLMNPNATEANRLAAALEEVDLEEWYLPSRLSAMGEALAALTERMNSDDAAVLSNRGASVLIAALENRKRDSGDLSNLRSPLSALAARMNSRDAATTAARLATILERSQEMDQSALPGLGWGKALAALTERMNSDDAAILNNRGALVLTAALEKPSQESYYDLAAYSEELAALAARMNLKDTSILADRVALVLTAALEKPSQQSYYYLVSCSKALADLAARMNPKDAAILAGRVASVVTAKLEKPQKNSSDLIYLGWALAALTERMNSDDAAILNNRGALVLIAALENWRTSDFGLNSLDGPLVALAARMNSKDAATTAARLAKALEIRKEVDFPIRLSILGKALVALSPRVNTGDATTTASRLATALQNVNVVKGDHPSRLSALGEALAALAGHMNSEDTAILANSGASVLADALELWQPSDSIDLADLGKALAALAARMSPQDAATQAAHGALVLAKALNNPKENNFDSLSRIGQALAVLSVQIPEAEQTRLTALSALFLTKVPPPPKQSETEAQERMIVAKVASLLTAKELADVLKWPFCVGEAQKLVLAELERKTLHSFGGDAWKFVEQVESLGINGLNRQFLDLPAKRPRIESAITELQALVPFQRTRRK